MKRKIFIITIITLLFSAGCEDFLDNPPQGYLTTASFPATPEDAILATNGVYNTLLIWNFHSGGFPILDIMSDEATKGSSPGDATNISQFDNFTFSSSASSIQIWWSTLYQGIRRSYLVTESLPLIEMNENIRNRLSAEVRFLRAYFYFTLIRAYGDVPKVVSTSPPKKLPRSPISEIYEEIIIPDLEFAMEYLPEKSEYNTADIGRVSKGAARGLLSKVYLFRKDFINAEKYALEVINSGQYTLDPDFAHAFSEDGENGTGSIFEIGAVTESGILYGGNQYANTISVRGTPNLGWGFGRPSWELIQFFGSDPRMDGTIVFIGETIEGITVTGDLGTPDTTYTDETKVEILEIECYNQKTFMPGTEPRYSWGHNRRILRYADVLLITAEALNENDKPVEALTYLNQVRERARGSNPSVLPDITTTNKEQLRDLILEERHRELALEGHRFWDLVRTDKAEEVLGPLGFRSGKNELMPIPANEINISEGVIIQNPDYL